jgi:hypothetical protein
MSTWIPALLAAASLDAAVIRGTVVSQESGQPLSQASVTLKAIAGSGGGTLTGKTNSFGIFEFRAAGGAYLLTATRQHYVPAYYGQKRWNSAGTPIVIEEEKATAVSIRMHRYGAITGRVLDENDVGILAHDVIAYRIEQPTQIVAQATTDDYGRYRLYGLTPGAYFVRSAAKRVDGVGYIPTWAPGVQEVSQARRVDVDIDLDSTGIDLRPAQGRLFEVSGEVKSDGPIQLTLAGETGRQIISGFGPFQFNPVAPGRYELYGSAPNGDCRSGLVAVYLTLPVEHDRGDLVISPTCLPPTSISYSVEGARITDSTGFALQTRHKDLAGILDTKSYPGLPGSLPLMLGQWDILLQTASSYCVTGFYTDSFRVRSGGRGDGWNDFVADGRGIHFVLSGNAVSLRGMVTAAAPDTAMGAPVYLEGYDPGAKARIGELHTTTADAHGVYRFDGLSPGWYRILATFEYSAPDQAAMDSSGVTPFSLARQSSDTKDLDLFVLK